MKQFASAQRALQKIFAISVVLLGVTTSFSAFAAYVIPRDCATQGCTPPKLDGFTTASEYADATRSPIQDFTKGRRTGEVAMVLDGRKLFVSIDLEGSTGSCTASEVDPENQRHRLQVLVDATGACSGQLGSDARMLQIDYDTVNAQPGVGTFTTVSQQLKGNGGGWTGVTPQEAWSISSFTRLDVTDGKRDFTIELAIELPDPPSPALSVQFGVRFESLCAPGALYQYPNDPNAGLDVSNSCTWEQLDFKKPEPVGLDIVAYNVGQMPFPIANGGSGEPMHFGFIASQAEHICFEETWTHDNRSEIYETANMFRELAGGERMASVNLPQNHDLAEEVVDALGKAKDAAIVTLVASGNPWIAGGVAVTIVGGQVILGDALGVGKDGEDNGLFFLSSRPILDYAVGEFNHDLCEAEDCLEDKGFLWAKVLLDSSHRARPGEDCDGTTCPPIPTPPRGLDGDEAVDIFCTHLQNDDVIFGSTADALEVRDAQASALRAKVQELAAGDRPAFVAGDFNFDGNDVAVAQHLYQLFGLDKLSTFDSLSVTHSDRYDLGISGPFTTLQVADAAASNPGGVPGLGTDLNGDDCFQSDPVNNPRLDFLLVVPPQSFFGMPTFALEDGSTAGPVPFFPGNSLDPNDLNSSHRAPKDGSAISPVNNYPVGGPATLSGECLSDHAALFAHAKLVRTIDPRRWNPKRAHDLKFKLNRMEAIDGDGCVFCGDPDFYGDMTGTLTSIVGGDQAFVEDFPSKHFGTVDDNNVASANISFDWVDPGLLSGQFTQADVRVRVHEEDDTSGDDEFHIEELFGPEGTRYAISGLKGTATVKGMFQDRLDCDFSDRFGPQQSCVWSTSGIGYQRGTTTYTFQAVEK